MTDKEKAVVMAHTGICMLTGEKFSIFHKYIEELMGRPVFTHELANAEMVNQITEKSKEDFLKLCKDELVPESCDDCISRADVEQTVEDNILCYTSDTECHMAIRTALRMLRKDLRKLPPVTPRPKMGRWIAYEVRLPDRTILNYRCSVCGRKLIGYNTETLSEAPFCHCGAKMINVPDKNDGKIKESEDKT